MGAKILVIDDEVAIRKLLHVTLEAHGYSVVEATNGKDGVLQSLADTTRFNHSGPWTPRHARNRCLVPNSGMVHRSHSCDGAAG
jgi:hypothetical protein